MHFLREHDWGIYFLDTAINFDTDNDLLICAGVNKYDVHNKNVSLTIFSVIKNKFEDFSKSNIKLLIKKRIDNICKEDIIAIAAADFMLAGIGTACNKGCSTGKGCGFFE